MHAHETAESCCESSSRVSVFLYGTPLEQNSDTTYYPVALLLAVAVVRGSAMTTAEETCFRRASPREPYLVFVQI